MSIVFPLEAFVIGVGIVARVLGNGFIFDV
jgi:hypothetical protein